jgi:FSR family fosmidomycin resistance protein-like MFS transporter
MSASRFLQTNIANALRRLALLAALFLLIEFLDELVFGVAGAAWPLIRDDLGLTYVQVGVLLGAPVVFSGFVEPLIGILGDVWKRRVLIVGGGLIFALSLLLVGVADSFLVLLIAWAGFAPASGAFVSLSQATLMDSDPARHEQWMARWTLAGSVGVVLGPIALSCAIGLGLGWRGVFITLACSALGLALFVGRTRLPQASHASENGGLREGLRGAGRALRRGTVWRWLILLLFSDFMLDILLGFLALYMVDVAGVSETSAGVAVAVWSGVGLLGDALLLLVLKRMRGLTYLRLSAAIMLVLYPLFLLVPAYEAKLFILGLMGLFNAGWYAILKGQLYSTLPGQSGTVMAIDSVFGSLTALVPIGLGWIAQQIGLGAALWLLLLGPIALSIGLPRERRL